MGGLRFGRYQKTGAWYIRYADGDTKCPDWNWSDDNSGVGSGMAIKASHVQDLRTRTKNFRDQLLYCACTCDCTCTCQCTCQCQCHSTCCDWFF